MAYNMVNTRYRYSPDPFTHECYTLECHDHSVAIVVTEKPSVVRRWVRTTLHIHGEQLRLGCLTVGLGVQRESDDSDIPVTLQLCVAHRCLVIHLAQTKACPAALRRFLSDDRITFVGMANERDKSLLLESRHRLQIGHLLDVRNVAAEVRDCGRDCTLQKLTDEILWWTVGEKQEQVGWDQPYLSKEQVEYVCLDVFLVFMIGKRLRAWKYDEIVY